MSGLTRRTLLASAPVATLSSAVPGAAAAPLKDEQAPAYYRFRIGAYELTALYDGIWYRPIGDQFIRNASFSDVESALDEAFMPHDKLATPFTTLIVDTGKKLVLIDTGTGGQISPTAGMVFHNLAAAGLSPKDVDQIVISHFHPDHINGLRDKDNKLIFPSAEIMVPEPEWAFWMDDANMNAARAGMKEFFLNQRRIFSDIAGKRHPISTGQGGCARHRVSAGTRPHAGSYRVCGSFRQGFAVGAQRYGSAPGYIRAPSYVGRPLSTSTAWKRSHAQKAIRSRRFRPHADYGLPFPVPGLRPSDQDRERLRARADRVAAGDIEIQPRSSHRPILRFRAPETEEP